MRSLSVLERESWLTTTTRSIEAIGPKGARATLRASQPAQCLGGGPAGDWLFDPVVVDSALQMQVIWARQHWDITLLPSAAAEFRRFGPLRNGSEVVRHELRTRPESQSPLSHADHLFFGPDGTRLAFGREAWEAFAAKVKADSN